VMVSGGMVFRWVQEMRNPPGGRVVIGRLRHSILVAKDLDQKFGLSLGQVGKYPALVD